MLDRSGLEGRFGTARISVARIAVGGMYLVTVERREEAEESFKDFKGVSRMEVIWEVWFEVNLGGVVR